MPRINPRRSVRSFTVCITIFGFIFAAGLQANAQDIPVPDGLLQAPVHEAFGQPVVFNPQPGILVAKQPPAPVDELPPDQKPDGDNVVWIAGYWSWDEQRQDFIWISGFWRMVPPGKNWVPGYWAQANDRYQWVSGFWANSNAQSQEYLPQPPASLESGPSTQPVSAEVIWAPGCWVWRERFVWRPGFWINAQADWIWVPAHYEWTPSGYVFIEGYWDYAIHRRGLLFAPVIFPGGLLARPRYVYTPSIVLDLGILSAHLFIRPAFHHYYFGDYYAADFLKLGIYPWFSLHNSHVGFDPFYAHASWMHRNDVRWLPGIKEQYFLRRDTVTARPPHTFAALNVLARKPNAPKELIVAHTLTDAVRLKTTSLPLHRVEPAKLNEFHQQATERRAVVQERAKFEAKTPAPPLKAVEQRSPVKWEIPKSKSTVVIVTPKGKGPPVLPTPPATHAEPPKPLKALPHPEEMLKHPGKK